MAKTRAEMTEWLQKIIKSKEINYEIENEEKSDVIRMGFRLDSAVSEVNITIVADEDGFHSYGFISNNAGKKMAEVAEFLLRANINDCGHFSLNYDTGEIFYEFDAPYGGFEEDDDLDALWDLPAGRFLFYGDSLLKVILGCASPKAAFEECINAAVEKEKEQEQK